jgi:hypothetical protein
MLIILHMATASVAAPSVGLRSTTEPLISSGRLEAVCFWLSQGERIASCT